ncbi:MAG TPA: hypothetical protein VNC59_07805 [Thermoanaerobaculia bacterium]|nr:hypothetical protein [Thermoanaerobaculia bacterium]
MISSVSSLVPHAHVASVPESIAFYRKRRRRRDRRRGNDVVVRWSAKWTHRSFGPP